MECNTIYNMDCIEGMRKLGSKTIDMVITSPPYDNLRNYNGYSYDADGVITELYRVLKDGGVVIWITSDAVVNGGETGTSFRTALKFIDSGFLLNDTMIYAKNNPMPQNGSRYNQSFEYMFCFSKGKPKTFNPITEPTKYKGLANMKNRGKNGELVYRKVERKDNKKVGNIFFYSIGGGISTADKIAYKHPAIFPEKLVQDQILTWSNEGDTILDPFMGSGTTAKICILNNRCYVGYEISKEYCEICEERLKPLK